MERFLLIALAGACAGFLGALVGVGGGIILVPALSLYLGVPIHQAVAASLVSVIANSSIASAGYARDGLANVRLGMSLEVATTLGALAGGSISAWLDRRALTAVFAAFLVTNAAYLLLRRREASLDAEAVGALGGSFHDPALGRRVSYPVRRLPLGLGVSAVAGAVSGLLGIGGGPIKVPMMTAIMGVPMKAAAATSNFMIGVTACASATLYYRRGMISPAVAAPVALGASLGAFIASRLAPRAKGAHLEGLLSLILLVLAVKMGLTAWSGR
jgi:uncharacterized protein